MSGIAPIDAPNPREPLHDARHRKASLEQDDLTALLAKLDAVESGEAALEEGDRVCVTLGLGEGDGGPILAVESVVAHVNLGAVLDEAAGDFGVAVHA